MNAMLDVFSGPAWRHLTIALLHTLWQSPVVAAVLWLLLRRIPAHRAEARYGAAFAALIGLTVCGLATWSVLDLARPVGTAVAASGRVPHATMPGVVNTVVADSTSARGLSQFLFDEKGTVPLNKVLEEDSAEGPPAWLAWLTAGWLLGVALMAGRTAWTVARLRRLSRGPEVVDPCIRQWTDELRCLLRVTRSLRIVETVEGFGPAVFGLVRPVLALPISLMTGLPPEVVRAVLAHELAHIRRHDYWFNLVQMAIEAVLFFNPAVWWISRQIRIEREACCDAMAARLLGRPSALAEALSLWAQRVQASAGIAAAAFSASGRRGPRLLLDRVRRLLLPGYRPQLPISPLGFLGMLLGGAVVLAALAGGTSTVVTLAAEALTPKQRIERIEQVQQEYAPKATAGGEVTFKGTIRTRGGEPVPKRIRVDAMNRFGNLSHGKGVQGSEFAVSIEAAGEIWLQFGAENYAPAILGPFTAKPGQAISGIKVVLDPGAPLSILVADEKRRPIQGAEVNAIPTIHGRNASPESSTELTDARGIAVFRHVIAWDYRLRVSRRGFQPIDDYTLRVEPGRPIALPLAHARPLRGVVLSREGRPIAGAEVKRFAEFRDNCSYLHQGLGPVDASTDDAGRFILTELEDDKTYCLLITAKGYGPRLVDGVSARKREVEVHLPGELTISGKIRGDLGELERDHGKPVISFIQNVSLEARDGDYRWQRDRIPVETVDGEGRFDLRDLLPGEVFIVAGKHDLRTSVDAKTPHREVVLDLTQPPPTLPSPPALPKRPVVFRFTTPDGSPLKGTICVNPMPPSGARNEMTGPSTGGGAGVEYHASPTGTQWSWDDRHELAVPIKNGVARVDGYVGGTVAYRPKGLIGYWFQEQAKRVEPGQEPLEIVLLVVPAGAIAGQMVEADGTPSKEGDWLISLYGRLETNTSDGPYLEFLYKSASTDQEGRFWVNPLPLGGKYLVTAGRGYVLRRTIPLELTAAKPTLQVTLPMPRTAIAEGKVLDPKGRPVTIAFTLLLQPTGRSIEGIDCGGSWFGQTDRQGQFRFDDLGVGVGEYFLEIKPERDFQPCRVPLPLDGKPIEVRLKPLKH